MFLKNLRRAAVAVLQAPSLCPSLWVGRPRLSSSCLHGWNSIGPQTPLSTARIRFSFSRQSRKCKSFPRSVHKDEGTKPMIFKIYHHKNPTFGFGETPEFNDENFELVAKVECDVENYGDVFRLTNSIDAPWWSNPEVTCIKKARSFSVGDVIVGDDGVKRRCESAGWTQF